MPYSNITFNISANLAYVAGDIVQLSHDANNYIIGTVVSYNKNTGVLVITPTTSVGSGTYTTWTVSLSGGSGSAGTTGTSGTAGDGATAGTSGNHGSSGDAASSGTRGTSGNSGRAGTHGTSGFSASSGASNRSATSGTSGTEGTSGTAGLDGSSGTSASSGSSGSSGTAASSGTSGTSGVPGASAVSGVNGGTGPTGPQGPTGPAGPTGSIAPNVLNYGSPVAFNSATVGNNWFYTGNLQTNANNQGLRTASNATFISNGNWISSGGVGSTNFFSTSTQMVKTNISPFSKSALDIIEDTDIVTFNFEFDGQDEQTHIGFIAEDTREELATSTHDRQNLVSTLGVVLKALQELDQKLKTLEGNA
jgi:hypothetical protein